MTAAESARPGVKEKEREDCTTQTKRPCRLPGLALVLSDLADDLVKLGDTLLAARGALLSQEAIMRCPHCDTDREGCFSIACWVHCDNGEPAEACGDANQPRPLEPVQLAYCSNCDNYFGPKPGHVFRVVQGRPTEMSL